MAFNVSPYYRDMLYMAFNVSPYYRDMLYMAFNDSPYYRDMLYMAFNVSPYYRDMLYMAFNVSPYYRDMLYMAFNVSPYNRDMLYMAFMEDTLSDIEMERWKQGIDNQYYPAIRGAPWLVTSRYLFLFANITWLSWFGSDNLIRTLIAFERFFFLILSAAWFRLITWTSRPIVFKFLSHGKRHMVFQQDLKL